MRIPRSAPVIALVAVVAFLAATGGAVAASMITSAQIQDDTIRSRDVHNGTLKLADISSAAQSSLHGSTGPVGPAGPSGPWATVNAAGDLVYSHGGVSATRTATGLYEVTFDHDVSYCGSVVTSLGQPASMSSVTGPRYGAPGTAVRVWVDNASGVPANEEFTLAMFC